MKAQGARLVAICGLLVSIIVLRALLASKTSALDNELRGHAPVNARAFVPDGYLVSGMAWGGPTSSCTVVRFVESGCNYCQQGEREWNRLINGLRKYGCQPVGLLPSHKAALPPAAFGYGGETQLAYITMDWLAGFHPVQTPSTIVVGPAGSVLWYRSGMLVPGDAEAAVKAVARTLHQ